MIYINPNDQKIKDAAALHFKFMKYVIMKKLNGASYAESAPFSGMPRINIMNGITQGLRSYLNNEANLRIILIGTPDKLESIKTKYYHCKEELQLLFNYENWVNKEGFYEFYHAYDLARALNIQTCVYCNRLYTKTVTVNGTNCITRPEFDHWFPKSKNPILALSFYNLIPSCHVCNSAVKKNLDMKLDLHYHPYLDIEINTKMVFSWKHKDYSNFSFNVRGLSEKGQNTIDAFKLQDVYETHEDEIKDLRLIRDTYTDRYLEILATQFKGLSISEEEIYRLAFGVHHTDNHFEKRPLSRMKRDILKELGIEVK
ncbi:hypothetical protein [Flavobacterium piscis]|uniref:HNH endonuclease n=1 Tax=Flavobacterium piscis TaxID=1114874 RepID=A0ABU1Y3Y5_9FLAO|nr:hypothetical protein [Flavobacterium piscis]MDR7208773.1 hypothetical protein [Flavobacterium piscis]